MKARGAFMKWMPFITLKEGGLLFAVIVRPVSYIRCFNG